VSQKSWEAIAHTLASRLMYHAYCENRCEKLDPENCPFCEDIAAYQAYVQKCEQAGRMAVQVSSLYGNAPLIPLEEALASPAAYAAPQSPGSAGPARGGSDG